MTDGSPPRHSWEALYQASPCGLLTTTLDGTIVEANDTLLEWLGRPRSQVIGTSFTSLLDPGSQLFYETRHLSVLRLTGEVKEVALGLRRGDGGRLPVLVNSRVLTDGNGWVQTALFDTSERDEYERELLLARRSAESSETRVRVLQDLSSAFGRSRSLEKVAGTLAESVREAFAATSAAVLLLDNGGSLRLIAGTDPLAESAVMQGMQMEAMASGSVVTLSDDAADDLDPDLAAALMSARLGAFSVAPLADDGAPIGVLVSFFGRQREFDDHYRALQLALARQAAQALTRIRLQEELERLALHDQLTGLANRSLIQHEVGRAIRGAAATGHPMAVIFLDLDRFKAINDDLGHRAGDDALLQVAGRLRASVRQEDAIGRFGGDEFVVVCDLVDTTGAMAIAERIRATVHEPLIGLPADLSVGASIGVAVFDPATAAAPTVDGLLDLADNAMYRSKSTGRDRTTLVLVADDQVARQ